ncbi:MAG: hypothetical protein JST75_07275 [Bacteroidetes bacterium]|nr:hypothetical protein [Bacteroidota bacterium]
MKKILSLVIVDMIIIITTFSCHPKIVSQKSVDARGNPMLLGKSSRQELEQMPYGEWFNKNFSDYHVDTAIAKKLRETLRRKSFLIFMGTWCGDSRREVPRMYKILDYCGVPKRKIQLITLNSNDSVYKQSPNHEERGVNIHRVPDLLVFDSGKEIGRIVESPIISLEQDLQDITTGKNYIPNYRVVPLLDILFKEKSMDNLQKDISNIAITAKPLISSVAELRSYGHVLTAQGEMDKARIAFVLNSLLYPDNASAFENLGDYYLKVGNKILAKENYKRSIELQPENENVKKILAQLE